MTGAAERVAMTLGCRDADWIPKVADAGQLMGDGGGAVQIMHNGLRVVAGAYHGDWMAQIITGLRGHHEPQEESVFHCLLGLVRPASLIVELASYWAYYTLWYLRRVPSSRALCIEPDPNHMAVGRTNCALNGEISKVQFLEGWVGGTACPRHAAPCESTGEIRTLPRLNMDSVLEVQGNEAVELLHMDAQGAELDFLRSMANAVAKDKIRFVMVSTHHASISGSASTHEDCLAVIENLGGTVLVEYDAFESFSGDGLIAAAFRNADRSLQMPPITRNRRERSLFPQG